jgi:S1-C subfamily serine protease
VPPHVVTCRCGAARGPDIGAPGPATTSFDAGDPDPPNRLARRLLEGVALLIAAGLAILYYMGGHRTAAPAAEQPRAASAPTATDRRSSLQIPTSSSAAVAPPAVSRATDPDPRPARAAEVERTDPVPSSLEDVVDRAMPSLVRVETASGFGSGFFVRPDTILTNAHVVGANSFVSVRRPDGRTVQGRVETTAPDFDIAVVRVADSDAGQPVLSIGSGIRMRPGQEVVALGTPLGLQNTVTRGIVSALRQVGPVSLVQTDAAINPGNSGGPILNRAGQVVAIATMTVKPGVGQGLSFGVAIDHAQALLDGRLPAPAAGSPLAGLNQVVAQPPSASPVDAARDEGARSYEQTIAQIARAADALDGQWRSFVPACYRGPIVGSFERPWFAVFEPRAMQGTVSPGCTAAFGDIRRTAERMRDEVHAADEVARRADVYPGTRRDVLRRNRLDYAGWER